jgi:hypothetical protein
MGRTHRDSPVFRYEAFLRGCIVRLWWSRRSKVTAAILHRRVLCHWANARKAVKSIKHEKQNVGNGALPACVFTSELQMEEGSFAWVGKTDALPDSTWTPISFYIQIMVLTFEWGPLNPQNRSGHARLIRPLLSQQLLRRFVVMFLERASNPATSGPAIFIFSIF